LVYIISVSEVQKKLSLKIDQEVAKKNAFKS